MQEGRIVSRDPEVMSGELSGSCEFSDRTFGDLRPANCVLTREDGVWKGPGRVLRNAKVAGATGRASRPRFAPTRKGD